MPHPEPSFVNQLQPDRPPCSTCGAPTVLARIEPMADSAHDLRTFECTTCGHAEVTLVKFK